MSATAALDADEVARCLAERKARVYSLEEVHAMTGFPLRTLQRQCRTDAIIHVHRGRFRGMTLDQIAVLVQQSSTGGAETAPDDLDEARRLSRNASRRRAA